MFRLLTGISKATTSNICICILASYTKLANALELSHNALVFNHIRKCFLCSLRQVRAVFLFIFSQLIWSNWNRSLIHINKNVEFFYESLAAKCAIKERIRGGNNAHNWLIEELRSIKQWNNTKKKWLLQQD